jgi:hypothetical protein
LHTYPLRYPGGSINHHFPDFAVQITYITYKYIYICYIVTFFVKPTFTEPESQLVEVQDWISTL